MKFYFWTTLLCTSCSNEKKWEANMQHTT